MPVRKGAPAPIVLLYGTESEYYQMLSQDRRKSARGRITMIEKSAQQSDAVNKMREYIRWLDKMGLGKTKVLAENKEEWVYETLFTS